jgi:cell division protease FtsH
MVFDLGMSASLGPVLVDSGQEILARSDRSGGSVAEAAEREVVRLLETADGACREVLTAHRDELDRLTHLLLERETLDRGELEAALVGLEAQPALEAR